MKFVYPTVPKSCEEHIYLVRNEMISLRGTSGGWDVRMGEFA
jgi:hypothetical protein